MKLLKIGDKVIYHINEKIISNGIITGIKYTSPLGNIYKVELYDKKTVGCITKNIHIDYLKKINI